MSAGHPHRRINEADPKKLKKLMASPSFHEMWARPFTVVTTYQIPDSAGYSVKADHYYLDEELVRQVRSGQISVEAMTPEQILGALLRHERTEKCLMDADNDVDTYEPAHEFATMAEHNGVRPYAPPYKYEKALREIIKHNEHKELTNVPPDLACAPYIDEKDELDHRAVTRMQALGVRDCGKLSKAEVKYTKSSDGDECQGCKHWQPEPGFYQGFAACEIVAGAVRQDRWCSRFIAGGESSDIAGDQSHDQQPELPNRSKPDQVSRDYPVLSQSDAQYNEPSGQNSKEP